GPEAESVQRHTTERQVTPGDVSRGLEELGLRAGRLRLLFLHRGPARADHAAGPEGLAGERARDGGPLRGGRPRPGEVHHLPPEPGIRAHGARLASELRGEGRGTLAHDAVQGQGAEGRVRLRERRALRLPGLAGRRRPAVQRPPRARWGRPTPAPGAHADARPALQRALRRDLRGARAHDPGRRGEGDGPRRSHVQDEQERAHPGRLRGASGRAGRHTAQDPARQDRLGLRDRRLPREARDNEPAEHLRRPGGPLPSRDRDPVRGQTLRRLQEGPRRGHRRDPGPHPRARARTPGRPRGTRQPPGVRCGEGPQGRPRHPARSLEQDGPGL
ncbi:MAG: Tryptophanyl-tRNA synthetase, partial [uncultured Rubrobacteraceae bacterium]